MLSQSPSSVTALFSIIAVTLLPLCGGDSVRAEPPAPLSAEKRQALTADLLEIRKQLEESSHQSSAAWADAAIFAKGAEWGLQFDENYSTADVALLESALKRCRERLKAVETGSGTGWRGIGRKVLGYRSTVDDSIQPYGIIVPEGYDPAMPIRLDVVLHGSSKPVGMSELRFVARFDDGDLPPEPSTSRSPENTESSPKDQRSDSQWIELHPLGRVENCYRWSGETDVFEAIEDVCRRYSIDRRRIVLRGMSMGASGTWHLGLKHPDRFAALGPYCGYVDTHRFSETPVPGFVRVGPLPPHQELGLHMLDSVDYAANAGVIPAVACMGEKDIFFQAHVLMEEAMRREGLQMTNLISPGTGHVIDPVTHAEQLRRIAIHLEERSQHPAELRFVTWTLKYSRCHWLQLLKLRQHYVRAEIRARLAEQTLLIDSPVNILRFAIDTAMLPAIPDRVRIGQAEFEYPRSQNRLVMELTDDGWRILNEENPRSAVSEMQIQEKRPGIQGPIDDAFCSPFLCVRGTGTPWNPDIQAYADLSLRRFAAEWKQYFRGELRIKDDSDVTTDDLDQYNLILFGDPGSNSLIARALSSLPIKWTKDSLHANGMQWPSASHLPAMIYPSSIRASTANDPSKPGEVNQRYVVLNSGHTFRKDDLAAFNYLLYPRWGDWAVLKIGESAAQNPSAAENVIDVGYFDEQWMFPLGTGRSEEVRSR